ncbi:hypothetical protein P691DRAFT_810298 [Macrolepiota fuliginosa MF-IS2]|uniref:Uncharacterized protein n=1 Tax=Macrolepiota fuliginosa MF-IS2 TaxID=1400762 RepID=A0A9P6C6S4_9AGAR|nr:hypothetical protein P691DRAFT_810298 [Macrolepiota fuliginosa MF-IS2]
MIHASTPELVSGSPLKPWFDPSTINPVSLPHPVAHSVTHTGHTYRSFWTRSTNAAL